MIQLPSSTRNASGDPIDLADWVELNLLVDANPEHRLSVTETVDLIVAEPAEDAEDEVDAEYRRMLSEQFAEAAFAHLREREGWLEDRYPFRCSTDVVELRSDTRGMDVYRFLVLLRARQLYQNALGDDGVQSGFLFEELATQAFGQYIGAQLEHRIRFGEAGGQRGSGLPAQLDSALKELSRRMDEGHGGNRFYGTGDFKADGVAWRAFGDRRGGQSVLLGQATISYGEWIQKQPAPRWSRLPDEPHRPIAFLARPMTAVAFAETIPPDISTALGAFSESWVSIPFDRLRILSLLGDQDIPSDLRTSMNMWADQMRARLEQ